MSTDIEQLKNTLDGIIDSTNSLNVLIEFEEVLDNLHMYSYKNWEYGEVIAGPDVSRYWITVTLMYPQNLMPDPDAALRLIKHGAKVYFKKDELIEPVKITSPDDFGETDPKTGKRKPKKKTTPVWLVTIEMPRDFVSEFDSSKVTINGVDIDMSDVDSAYDTDYDNDIAPNKEDLTGGLE